MVLMKNMKLRILVDFHKFNVVTRKDMYPFSFTNDVFNTMARHEAYSFINGYYGYHQISITLEDMYKITFAMNWGAFIWLVMPFKVKNGPGLLTNK